VVLEFGGVIWVYELTVVVSVIFIRRDESWSTLEPMSACDEEHNDGRLTPVNLFM